MYGLKPVRLIEEQKKKILLENESPPSGKTEKV
jgi:hypothetical protein